MASALFRLRDSVDPAVTRQEAIDAGEFLSQVAGLKAELNDAQGLRTKTESKVERQDATEFLAQIAGLAAEMDHAKDALPSQVATKSSLFQQTAATEKTETSTPSRGIGLTRGGDND